MWFIIALQLEILSLPSISQPTIALLCQILSKNLWLVFSSNPYPYLNIEKSLYTQQVDLMLYKIIIRSKCGTTILGCKVFSLRLSRIFLWAAVLLHVIPLTQLLLLFIVFSLMDMTFTYSTNDDPLRWLSGRVQARRCLNCFSHAAHYPTKNPTVDRYSWAHIFCVFSLLSSDVNTITL